MAKAVLFDLYETLVSAPWSVLVRRWADRLGIDAEKVRWGFDATRGPRGRGHFDSVDTETAAIIEASGISPDAALLADLVVIEAAFLADQVLLFSDTFSTLDSLQADRVMTAIVSNCSRPTAAVVDQLGLRDAVDLVVLSFEVGSVKPEPEIFREAISVLGVETGLFVDDQAVYLDGAASVGLSTRQMIHPEARNPRPPAGNHEVVNSLSELLAALNHPSSSNEQAAGATTADGFASPQ